MYFRQKAFKNVLQCLNVWTKDTRTNDQFALKSSKPSLTCPDFLDPDS